MTEDEADRPAQAVETALLSLSDGTLFAADELQSLLTILQPI